MKTLQANIAAEYAKDAGRIASMLKVTRTDSAVRGYTSLDVPLVFDGVTYEPGFDVSSLASTETLGVDNMELTIFPDGDSVLDADLIAGRWDNAAFVLFEIKWDDLNSTHLNVLKTGNLGQVQFKTSNYVAEFRSKTQALQQTQGMVTQLTCRARLGDARCTKDLTAFTYTGAISTADPDGRHFTSVDRTEATNWFAEGEITMTSGLNVNISRKIKSNTGDAFLTVMAFPFALAIGDTYTIVAGCDKTLATCRDKFSNILNMQAEPHMPGLNALTKPGGTPVQAATTAPVPDQGTPYGGDSGT